MAGTPVMLAGSPVGTLNVYQDKPAGWDESDVRALRAYGDLIAEVVRAALSAHDHSVLTDQLRYGLDYRVAIERAVGYLMGSQGLDAVTAFNVLANGRGTRSAAWPRWPPRCSPRPATPRRRGSNTSHKGTAGDSRCPGHQAPGIALAVPGSSTVIRLCRRPSPPSRGAVLRCRLLHGRFREHPPCVRGSHFPGGDDLWHAGLAARARPPPGIASPRFRR